MYSTYLTALSVMNHEHPRASTPLAFETGSPFPPNQGLREIRI
jgi:hypothetical protein